MPGDGEGQILKTVLLGLDGSTLQGVPVEASGSGKDVRIRPAAIEPLPVRISRPVRCGSHAAVAAGLTDNGEKVAVRVELYRPWADAYRRAAMVRAAGLVRENPEAYPALLRVRQCFITRLPDDSLLPGAEVICDVLEWCASLDDVMQAGYPDGMGAVEAVRLILPVVRTVDRLHRVHNWVHRDIDEVNVLVASDGMLRVADLGIVSVITPGQDHTYTAVYGKQFALPPEARRELMGGRGPDRHFRIEPSYDTWQIGRLLYMLLTGDKARVPELHRIDPTSYWHRWDAVEDKDLRHIVAGMVDADPDRRTTLGRAHELLFGWLPPKPPEGERQAQTSSQRVRVGSAADNDVVLQGLAPFHLSAERMPRGTWVVRDISPERRGFEMDGRQAMWAEVPDGQSLQVGSHRICLGSTDAG